MNQSYNIYAQPSAIVASKSQKSKISTSRKIKNILKPVLGRIFKTKKAPKRSSYIASAEKDYDFEWIQEIENLANEELENRIIDEIHNCSEDAAIYVYNPDGDRQLETIDKENFYVPVHFARTNAGTFFWTSIQRETIEPYQIEWNFLDRWGQA
ncbi:enhancer of split malpha protein [Episyrphus balteatus]|uniref:enhancer of split malpha protein n=1 Tax=Episyrphus balteatus TaxID=286459 RepID=UPI0024869B1D|nr:enhancer of split malpha protein [Episyrphus balteatus]